VSTELAEQSKSDESAELNRLQHQVVAQARELALLRWEISSLLRRHPVSGRVTEAKYSILRRVPKLAHKIAQSRWVARNLLGSAPRWRPRRVARASGGLGASLTFRTPILLVGNRSIAERIASNSDLSDFLIVSPGAGPTRSLSVPQVDEPALRLPVAGSLVAWLLQDPIGLRRIGTIIVDVGDELSLGLLRGRLNEGQALVLISTADHATSINSVIAELGKPSVHERNLLTYTSFPAAWLDPLDEHHRPISPIATQLNWPKISVVMVSFNQASFLEEGLRSVLEQGYPNLEFIVIDGNSTDGSAAILHRYRSRLSDLVIESDHGQSEGLNKGLWRAAGDILTWVNSDDLLEPGALFRAAQAFRSYDVDMVAGGCRQIGQRRNDIILNHHNRLPFGIPVALPLGLLLDMDRFWLTGSFFYQPEVFFSREIWNRSGGKLRTDLNYVLDYDLWVRMAAAGATIVHIPDFLACSRTHDQQKTTVGMPQMPEIQWLLRDYARRLMNVSG
jgi:hypothetical protein